MQQTDQENHEYTGFGNALGTYGMRSHKCSPPTLLAPSPIRLQLMIQCLQHILLHSRDYHRGRYRQNPHADSDGHGIQ